MTTVSSSGSPCLSPIRCSLDTSQINQNEKSLNIDDNISLIPIEETQPYQLSLPIDDSSMKVSSFRKIILRKKTSIGSFIQSNCNRAVCYKKDVSSKHYLDRS
jgi:hypothetical protein